MSNWFKDTSGVGARGRTYSKNKISLRKKGISSSRKISVPVRKLSKPLTDAEHYIKRQKAKGVSESEARRKIKTSQAKHQAYKKEQEQKQYVKIQKKDKTLEIAYKTVNPVLHTSRYLIKNYGPKVELKKNITATVPFALLPKRKVIKRTVPEIGKNNQYITYRRDDKIYHVPDKKFSRFINIRKKIYGKERL